MSVPAEMMAEMAFDETPEMREAREEAERQRAEELDKIGVELMARFNEAMDWRREYEQRWADADKQFRTGTVPLRQVKDGQQARAATPINRRAPDNITMSKTKAIIARRQDMLFTDRNWTLRASPVPTLVPQVEAEVQAQLAALQQAKQQAGGQVTDTDIAAIRQTVARQRAGRMTQKVADLLSESDYDKHGRAAVESACKYGSGVMELFIKNVTRRSFDGQQFAVMVTPTLAVEHIELACFFPQPCRHISEAEWAFKLHVMPKRDIAKLAEQGFDTAQLNRLLEIRPSWGAFQTSVLSLGSESSDALKAVSGRYPVLKYRGPIPRKCYEYFGVPIPDETDHLTELYGEVWLSQGIVLKASLDPMAAVGLPPAIGYFVTVYERDPNSCFGYGVPHIVMADQDAANIAWSAALASSIRSSVPIVGLLKRGLSRTEGTSYDLMDPSPWELDGTDDVRKVVSVTTIPSTMRDSMEIYERAKANADEHAMLPSAAQGEATNATPQTASGLAMLMNAGNIIQRHAANEWDDEVTRPLLRAVVDFLLAHGQDPSVLGDFDVVPIASSHLLVKDVRLQQALMLLQLVSADPDAAMKVKKEVLIDLIVRDMELPSDELLRSDEEVAQRQAEQQPQPSPEQIKAEAALATAEIQRQSAMEVAEIGFRRAEMQAMTDAYVADANRQTAMMKLASDEKKTLEQLDAMFNIKAMEEEGRRGREEMKASFKASLDAMKEETKRMKIGADAEIKARDLLEKRESRRVQMAVEKPVRLNG